MRDERIENQKKAKEKHAFQAETKELLNIMINSLYTHREIFLRELISNASDALDKLSFQSLTDSKLLEDDAEFIIVLKVDKENKTLSVYDNGIGMTYQEVIDNIGTIAKSGSKLFIKQLKEQEDIDLIGKFGVGFYSSFMVSKKIEILTRAAGQKKGVRWESKGDGTFSIEEIERKERGTRVILHLRKDAYKEDKPEEDFSNQYTIRNLIEKYSNYIRYPIKMDFIREEQPRDKDGKVIEGSKAETVIETKTLNSMIPIWEKNKKEITKDEYFQFYKHHFHDWNEFADVIHIKAEGRIQYTALLFLPSKASSDLYDKEYSRGINLYANHVFIMKDCQDLLPDHLRFVRGLVDSADFSLNISREILQHNTQLRVIGKNLEKKVLESLSKLLETDRKKYEEIWQEIGKAIKGGIYMAYKNKDSLQDLLLFGSSRVKDGKTTLKEYVERMPEGQNEIYFATGKDIDTIERLPHLEIFREKGIEILYFTDKIDEFLTQNLDEYKKKKLKSISRGDLDLDRIVKDKKENKTKKDHKEEGDKKEEEQYKDLLETIKIHLGARVTDVKISHRLTSSPVCMVTGGAGPTFNMELLMKGANQISPPARKVLELNPEHKVFATLQKIFKKDKHSGDLKNYCEILFNQALLIEGYELEDPVDFSKRLSELMANSYKEL